MKRDKSIPLTYQPPCVRMVFMLDMESQILNPSNDQKNLLKVDPVQVRALRLKTILSRCSNHLTRQEV